MLRPIAEFSNVIYDGASAYPWERLNETAFLEAYFRSLARALGTRFGDYEFHVVSSHDPHVVPESARPPAGRKVLVFISDESSSVPEHLVPYYSRIFKAYLPHEPPSSTIHAFSIGCVKEVPALPPVPFDRRSIDLFFSGNLNEARFALYREVHPLLRRLPPGLASVAWRASRRLGWPRLRMNFSDPARRSEIGFSSAFKGGLAPGDYAAKLSDSKIVLCPRGFQSAETFRHMEAMRAGAVVVSEALPPTRLYSGAPIVTVRNWREGLRTAAELLARPAELVDLHRQTVAWWNDVCSAPATARASAAILDGAA